MKKITQKDNLSPLGLYVQITDQIPPASPLTAIQLLLVYLNKYVEPNIRGLKYLNYR